MAWTLHDHLRYAVSQDRGIFLDLAANRYFALPEASDRLLRCALASDDPPRAAHPGCAQLVRRGLLRWSDAPVPAPSIIAPVAELAPARRASAALTLALLLAQWRAARDVKHAPLRKLAATLGDQRLRGAPRDGVDLNDLAAAARALQGLAPSQGRCLPLSLAFVRLCRSRGRDVRLVLGVSGAPFAAHCWAQTDDCVLNDRLERVRAFTPIAAWG